jgi:hypothetical protein
VLHHRGVAWHALSRDAKGVVLHHRGVAWHALSRDAKGVVLHHAQPDCLRAAESG